MASIRKIEGKKGISYKIEVSNGYDMNGKKIRETTTFVPDPTMTKKQQEKAVQQFAAEFEERVKNGNRIQGDRITLAEFTQKWFETYGDNQLERTTIYRYHYLLDNLILPALGHMKLAKIRPFDVTKFLASLTKDGVRQDGEAGGYAYETIRKAKTTLSAILSTAVKWEIIENNPCLKADLPKMDEPEETLKVYTLDQTKRLLQFAEDDYKANRAKRVTMSGNVIRFSVFTEMDIASLQTLVLIHIGVLAAYAGAKCWGLTGTLLILNRALSILSSQRQGQGAKHLLKRLKVNALSER